MSTALALPYEDLEEGYDGRMRYNCPNEDTLLWKNLLGGKKFERAGGICSGGEVGLWAMLPSVTKELLLIDHSYKPLAFAATKYLLIRKIGFTKAKKVLSELTKWSDLDAHLGKGWQKKLPEKMQVAFLKPTGYYGFSDEKEVCRNISAYWKTHITQVGGYRYPTSKLAKVRFLHGDFRSLEGQFDLFYVSNAFEGYANGNRVGTNILLKRLNELVKPGGYVLAAHKKFVKPTNWELVNKSETTRFLNWTQAVYEVK